MTDTDKESNRVRQHLSVGDRLDPQGEAYARLVRLPFILLCLLLIASVVSSTWCDNSYTSKFPITFYFNQTVLAQNNLIGYVSVNTSNNTLFNSTTGTNVRFYNETDCSLIPFKLMSNNTTFLGSAINNSTYAVVVDMPDSPTNSSFYLYAGNLTAASGESNTTFCNQAQLARFWPLGEGSGTNVFEFCAGNNGTLTGLGAGMWNASGKHGFGLKGADSNQNDRMTFAATYILSGAYSLFSNSYVVDNTDYKTLWYGGGNYLFLTWTGTAELSVANPQTSSGFREDILAAGVFHQFALSCGSGATGLFNVNGSFAGPSGVTCKQGGTIAADSYMGVGSFQAWDALTSDPMIFSTNKSAEFYKGMYSLHAAVGAEATMNTTGGVIASLVSPSDGISYPATTTQITFTWNCAGQNASYLANISINETNNYTVSTLNNTNTQATINFSNVGNYNWIVTCYNDSLSNISAASYFSIGNVPPNITTFNTTANGSAYQLGPLAFSIKAIDVESTSLIAYYSVFRNNTNVTAWTGTATIANNTMTQISLDFRGPFNATDWYNVSVFVSDGTNQSVAVMGNNTTIGNYFSNISFSNAVAYGDLNFQNILNLTLAGASSASAVFEFNGVNNTATSTGSPTYILTANAAAPTGTYTGNWFYTATLSNGSTFTTNNTTASIFVNISGFYLCNGSINTSSIVYTFQNALTLATINATLDASYSWVGDDGITILNNILVMNNTTTICVYPPSFNRTAVSSESVNATGYLPYSSVRPAQNYSSSVINNFVVFLTNSSTSGYYTFQTIDQFSSPISGASIAIVQDSPSVVVINTTTGVDGAIYVPLQQFRTYHIYVSATGFNNRSFIFIASATTTIQIPMQPIGATLPAVASGQAGGSCAYSTTTGILTCSATTTTLDVTGFGLVLYQMGAFTTNCSNISMGSTVTLTCAVPQINDTIWQYALYTIETVSNESITTGSISINIDRAASLGRDSWFIMLFLFLFLAAVGAAHPLLGISFGILGMLLAVFVQLIPFNAVSGIIMVGAVTAGIIIHRLRS